MTHRITRSVGVLVLSAIGIPAVAVAQLRPPLRPPQPPPTEVHPTFAKSRGDHGAFFSVGGAVQLTSSAFTSAIQPLEFAERAAIQTRYSSSTMPGFDIGGGARVWRRLAAAVNVERLSKSGGGAVDAQVPHPFFFNRLRAVSGDATNLHRAETAVHMQAVWMMPLTPTIEIDLSGGPSWISVDQDLVNDVRVAQTYPYDTATFDAAVSAREKKAHLGVNAGMTLDYRFAPRVGVAVTARYSHARVRFDVADSAGVNLDAGGAHVGAGIRFRF